jgi:protein kinase C substrate 80K-H
MAVLEAVRGWEELAGLPHINDVKKGDGEEGEVVEETRAPKLEEPVNDDLWTADELDNELDDLLQSDYTALLLEHEDHINAPTEDSIRM